MKIAIELNAAQTERLRAIASELAVDAEQLAQAAIVDLISASADDSAFAALRVLKRSREPYQRLATG